MRIRLSDLAPGVTYALRLRSNSGDAVSDWSRVFNITTSSDVVAPKVPTGLAVSFSGSTFIATWNAVTLSADNTPAHDLDHYEVKVESSGTATTQVYYSADTRFEFDLQKNIALFTSPRPSITFSVRALDKTGNASAYSTTVTATNPPPSNPTGFTADPVVDGISLKWNAVAESDVTGYKVYYGTTAGTQNTLVWTGNATAKTVANFAYSTDAYYRVVAVDVFNSESTSGPVVGPVRPKSTFAVDTQAPATPTGLAATLTNATDGKTAKADVTWSAVTDTDGDLSEYIIGYKPSSDTNWQYTKVDYTNTATTINGLLPYTNYDFRVRSSDWAANLSAWSSVVTKTATANSAPATVTGVSVTGGKDSLTIKWTANTEPDVANGAGVYLVDVATNTGFTTGLLSYRTGEASLTVTGLAQGTTYYVRVKAVDSLGLASAAWSTTANATTGTLATQFTYTTAATAPSSPNVGDIWMDTTSGFEKQWTGSAWVNTGNASVSYVDTKTNPLVKTYVNEYAVNSSETVAPVSGWSTTQPARTPGTFVWFRTTVTKSDNTTSTTSPALLTGNTGAQGSQGIPGNPGADGVSLYTWIKYADTPTTGMSDSPTGKTYMGIAYNKTSSTESSVYSDYEWSLIKGTDGIQGPPGNDGQTTYTWVKYADTVTGTGMSDDPTGKTYIGLAFNKTTATESTTATDYQWSLIQGPQGAPGTPAATISLTATAQVLTSPAAGGATTPASTTVTGTPVNTTITAWTYSVDGAAFSATVPAGVSRTGNVVTITGSAMTARTIAVKMADANGVSDTLTVAKAFDGATGATGGTGSPGAPGADAVTVLLTNEAATFAAGTTNALASSATTQVNAWKGTTAQSVSVGTITGGATGITAAVTNNNTTSPTITFTVTTALTTANGTFTIPVTAGGITVNQIFTWSLAFTGAQGTQGNPGANAKSIDLTTTTQVLASPSGGGATTPATATVTGAATNTTISVWEYAVDGGAFSGTVPAGVSRTGNVVTITGSTMTARTITVRMADSGGVADTLTVAKTFDGATGGTGGTGPAGADAYTVILTNEAQVFPGSTTAALAGSATSSVIAYKGATQIAATIGTITGQVTGLTTAITNNGTTNATVTVTVTTALTTQSGVLTIPITADGKSFTKSFAWSVSYTGAQGATGNTGPTGVGITSVTPYFAQVTTGAAAPAKPTTATPSAPWQLTEPDYVANTELYRTEKVLYTNATYSYTDVQKVSSYAAAATAIASANGKNKITHSTGTPGTTANTAGDTWVQYDGSNNIIAQFRGMGGTTWVQESIASAFIANLDAGKLTANSAFVTTLNIGTGGVIQSAGYTSGGSSGFQLSTSGLTIKGSGNVVDAGVLKGGIITGTTINVGAGGTLNVDSTGVIKSNNYSSGSTGYQLSNTGLEVNDGSIDAKALKTGSAVIGDLTIGRSADTAGSIISYGYAAGVSGFKLSKSGLEINDGSISASALKLQNGHNMMPPAYADFEYGDAYYIHPFWNPRGQAKFTMIGAGICAANPADANATPVAGKNYFAMSTLGGTNALEGWMGTSTTDYNIKVDQGQTYIVSGYFKNWSTSNTQWNLVVKGDNGSTLVTYPIDLGGGTQQLTWTRVWTTVTIPAGVNNVIVGVTNPDTTLAKDFHIDAMQFEPKLGALSTPSVWKPPAQTTISPSGITTGLLRSSSDITVGGTTQPAWSINMDGNMQVGDALVRGKLIVGTGSETAPNRAPNNGDFETDVNGYSVYQTGASSTAIARTTTAGEFVMGTGAAKVTAAAGTKTSLGMRFNTHIPYPSGTTLTVSGYVRSNAAGGSLYADMLNASSVVMDTEAITTIPTANDAYYFSATFSIESTSDVTSIALYQNNGATGITTTSIIFDTIVVNVSTDMAQSFVASANFITGDAGQGWKIDGNGNVEFNSGYFRGQLGSGIVTADSIASDIVMSSTFRTGYSGQRVEFDSTGIVMYDTINQPIIQLPTDPNAKATFQGDLVASSMTVEDQLAIRGNGNEISKGSTVTLQSGTTAPSSPPTVTVDWKTIAATNDPAFAPYRYGITVQGGWFRTAQVVYGGGTIVDSYDLNTGARQWGSLNTAANDGMWNALGGITSIGNNVYMLGTNKAGQWRLMGWTFGTSVTGTPTRIFNVSYPQSADHRIPALGNDGTNLIVALTNQTNLVQVRSFSATTGAQLTAALVSDLSMASDVAFVNKGSFDNGFGLTAGTPVYVVGLKNSSTAYVLDQNFKRLSSGGYDFPLITKPAGQCFYNGKFYTFDAAGNRITEHTGATWNSNTAGMDKWWAANSWYNSTGPYETMIGPLAGFTMKKRARAVITSPPIPKALGVPEDVKAVGLYMARGNTTPTRTQMQRQTYLADGVRTIKMQEELNSTMPTPGATNTDTASQPKSSSNFPNTTPGALKDAAGRFNLYGDGSGNWAGLTVSNTGVLGLTANTVNATKLKIGGGNSHGTNWAEIYKNATWTANNAAWTTVSFSTYASDGANILKADDGTVYTSSSLWARVSGFFSINASITFAASATGYRAIRILDSNGNVVHRTGFVSADTPFRDISISATMYMVAGDNVQVQVYQNSGAAMTMPAHVADAPCYVRFVQVA